MKSAYRAGAAGLLVSESTVRVRAIAELILKQFAHPALGEISDTLSRVSEGRQQAWEGEEAAISRTID